MTQCEGRVRKCPNGVMLRTSTWHVWVCGCVGVGMGGGGGGGSGSQWGYAAEE